MSEFAAELLKLVEVLGPIAWVVVIGGFVIMLVFLGIFIWFSKKIFDDMNKPFFKSEYEEDNRRLKEELKKAKKNRWIK